MLDMNEKIKKLVIAALMAALTCVMTLVVQIPMPLCGYVNLGDGVILLSAVILGPLYGALAGAIGACLADIISGFAIYAPGTFVIKALIAVVAFYVYKAMSKHIKNTSIAFVPKLIAGVLGEIVMIAGYFVYEATVMGYGLAAASGLVGNSIQGVVAVVVFVALAEVITRNKALKKFVYEIK